MGMIEKWYTLQTLSGKEMKAKDSLEKRILQENLEDDIFEVLVPQERVTEVRQGKKYTTNRKFFPGYIFINVRLVDESGKVREDIWHFIKDTNGIIGFLGGDAPVSLSAEEIENIKVQATVEEAPRPRVEFNIGDKVKIKDGAFESFEGEINEVDPERGKLQLSVVIFGRSTPVEVEYWQVERVIEE